MRKNFFLWLRLAISAGAIIFLVSAFRDRLGQVFHLISTIPAQILFLAFSLLFLSQLLVTARLKDILRAQDVDIKYKNLFLLSMIALFFNNFLPSALGGCC